MGNEQKARKTSGARGNLNCNAVADLSKVFHVLKPLLLTLHSRGIICDQDTFLTQSLISIAEESILPLSIPSGAISSDFYSLVCLVN